jgi:hypothetical protein
MRSVYAVALIATAALAAGSTWTSDAADERQQSINAGPEKPTPVRRLIQSPGRPILPQVRDTDVVVEVVDPNPPGLPVIDASGKVLETYTRLVPYVAIIKVTSVESTLNPEGDFVNSTVWADIADLLKPETDQKGLLVEGGQISFNFAGGVLTLGKQTIKAYRPWAKPFLVGRTYLVFADAPGGRIRISPTNAYLIQGNSIERNTIDRDRTKNDIESDNLEGIKARVKAVSQKQ